MNINKQQLGAVARRMAQEVKNLRIEFIEAEKKAVKVKLTKEEKEVALRQALTMKANLERYKIDGSYPHVHEQEIHDMLLVASIDQEGIEELTAAVRKLLSERIKKKK